MHGIGRITQPKMQAVNFARPIERRKLNGSVINESYVDSEISCQFKCVEKEGCQSYNFETKKNQAGKLMCQLSNSNRFVSLANFTQDEDFKYGGVQVILRNIVSFNRKVPSKTFHTTLTKMLSIAKICLLGTILNCFYSKNGGIILSDELGQTSLVHLAMHLVDRLAISSFSRFHLSPTKKKQPRNLMPCYKTLYARGVEIYLTL